MDRLTVSIALSVGVATALYFFILGKQNKRRSTELEYVDSKVVVTELFIYPVKSCRGISVASANVGKYGLENDRSWMVVNEKGRFVTQRQVPAMALIEPRLTASHLHLHSGQHAPLQLPLSGVAHQTQCQVAVWDFTGPAYDQGDEAAQWLTEVLGKEGLRLVRMGAMHERAVERKWLASEQPRFDTSFSDGYPMLVISEESLQELNEHLRQRHTADQLLPLPMRRFRPNIVIKGAQHAFFEDSLGRFAIGSVELLAVSKCPRCKVTTVNPETGRYSREELGIAPDEPLDTLRTFRKDAHFDAAMHDAYFGINLVHYAPGHLQVGQPLRLPSSAPSSSSSSPPR